MRSTCSVALAAGALLLAGSALSAQDAEIPADSLGWHRQMVGQLNLSQVSFDNWAQGGENSIAWQLTGTGRFRYEQPRYTWANSIDLGYGRTKLGSSAYRKSVDEIRLESVLTYRSGTPFRPYGSASLRTQFSTGYTYDDNGVATAISGFMDPGYLTESAGLAWVPSEVFTTRLGAALRETFTRNYPNYADNPDTPAVEKTRVEGGIESATEVNAELAENLLLTSKLDLFSNLKAFNEIDVDWNSTFTAKVASWVNVNVNMRLLYDRTVSPKRQLKQALALGLSYSFLTN